MPSDAPLIVGVTGGSGAALARRVMARAVASRVPLVVTATDAGLRVWAAELGGPLKATLAELGGTVRFADARDIGDPIASGSVRTRGMVVAPASMNAVSAIATGRAENLLQRAADVTLKEGRPLTLVPRETPLSTIHLENLLKLARLGVRIVPPMPAFYLNPRTLEELYDQLADRVVRSLAIEEMVPDDRFTYGEER